MSVCILDEEVNKKMRRKSQKKSHTQPGRRPKEKALHRQHQDGDFSSAEEHMQFLYIGKNGEWLGVARVERR